MLLETQIKDLKGSIRVINRRQQSTRRKAVQNNGKMSSDAKWRFKLTKSFDILRKEFCPHLGLSGKNSRKEILEYSLEQIKELEEEVSTRYNLNQIKNSFSKLEQVLCNKIEEKERAERDQQLMDTHEVSGNVKKAKKSGSGWGSINRKVPSSHEANSDDRAGQTAVITIPKENEAQVEKNDDPAIPFLTGILFPEDGYVFEAGLSFPADLSSLTDEITDDHLKAMEFLELTAAPDPLIQQESVGSQDSWSELLDDVMIVIQDSGIQVQSLY